MAGFKTAYTTYFVDSSKRLFWGGQFKSPVRYKSASCILGCKAVILLEDGRTITTGVVTSYL